MNNLSSRRSTMERKLEYLGRVTQNNKGNPNFFPTLQLIDKEASIQRGKVTPSRSLSWFKAVIVQKQSLYKATFLKLPDCSPFIHPFIHLSNNYGVPTIHQALMNKAQSLLPKISQSHVKSCHITFN